MDGGKIVVSDDDKEFRQFLKRTLESRGHIVEAFPAGQQLLKAFGKGEERPDLALLDSRISAPDGLETLRRIRGESPETTVVVMTAFATVRHAVEALKLGASDYLIKPFSPEELTSLVDRALENRRLLEENRSLKAEIRRHFDPEQVIFRSAAFGKVFELARKVAPSDANVLIQGESGTGKELIASTIHYGSRRRSNRFLTINCAALTDTLLESQLFGHMRGAFTGAVATNKGLVEEAHRGTLFLDEIGDISPQLQAKLLRVLQEGEYIPVGSNRVRHADVRFIAATNRDLETEVERGAFREDLFYRLNVVNLHLPPLRDRVEDIEPLARHFLGRFATRPNQTIHPEALDHLKGYSWPGNARELENVIEMAVILAEGGDISPDHLPVKISQSRPVEFALPREAISLQDVERLYIEQVYRQARFHKVRTADILGISRKTLDRKLKEYEISKGDKK